MKRELLEIIRCPECAAFPLACEGFDETADGGIKDGVVWCTACGSWYPIEDAVLELLQPAIAYADDRRRFWEAREDRLKDFGLTPFVPSHGDEDDVHDQRHQQEHFDWYGENGTQTYAAYEKMQFWRLVDQDVFAGWREHVKPGRRLLDIGCAQGRSTFQLHAPDLTVVGFDISKRLVAQAVARARGRGSMHFFVGDATRMPIVDQSFDYALIYGVLHHLPGPARICREAARVLKDGGMLFCSENNQTAFRPFFDWLQRLRPIWHEEAGEHSQIHSTELKGWLSQAGFVPQVWTGVFLPPHMVNLLPARLGRDALDVTNQVLTSVPWLRHQGGLIMSTSVKLAR